MPIGYVRLARYFGKMCSRHIFPYDGLRTVPTNKQVFSRSYDYAEKADLSKGY